VLEGVLRHLGTSDAPWCWCRSTTSPGDEPPERARHGPERPNWVQRLPFTLPELAADERITATLAALQDCRLGAYLRAEEPTA
jgi:hypothetical protein